MARKPTRYPRGLTPRQREVLKLAQARLTNAEIAARLELSVGTVRSHLKAASRHAQPGKRRRSLRQAAGPPRQCLSRAETELLEAILQSPLVGELARLVNMSSRSCRSLLESIVRNYSEPSNRSRRPGSQASIPRGEDAAGPSTSPGSGEA